MSSGLNLTLDEFLAQEARHGVKQDEGHFTVSLGAAVEKLSRYQLEDPNHYLLRLVQSAALIGGRRLHLEVRGRVQEMSFRLDQPGSFSQAGVLLQALAKPAGTKTPTDHLVAALQATLGHGLEDVCWSHERPEFVEEFRLAPTNVDIARRYEHRHASGYSVFRLKATTPVVSSWSGLLQWMGGRRRVYGMLEDHCLTVPTELTVGETAVQRLGGGGGTRFRCCRLAGKRLLELGFRVELPKNTGTAPVDSDSGMPLTVGGESLRCSFYLENEPDNGQVVEVFFVRDGVIVGKGIIPGACGCSAWYDATGLQTDLSGLKLVQDRKFEEALRRVAKVVERYRDHILNANAV